MTFNYRFCHKISRAYPTGTNIYEFYTHATSSLRYKRFRLDRSDGQFFKAMEWRWLFFSNDGMAMVFENSHHHHRWFLAGSTIDWQRWFFYGFSILGTNGSRWLQSEICDKMNANKNVENRNANY